MTPSDNKNVYTSLDDAKEELKNNSGKYEENSGLFCPITNDFCTTNCVSWEKPYIHTTSVMGYTAIRTGESKTFEIQQGYCRCPLITGVISVT